MKRRLFGPVDHHQVCIDFFTELAGHLHEWGPFVELIRIELAVVASGINRAPARRMSAPRSSGGALGLPMMAWSMKPVGSDINEACHLSSPKDLDPFCDSSSVSSIEHPKVDLHELRPNSMQCVLETEQTIV